MDWNNYLGEIRLGDTLYAVRHTFIWDDDNEIIKKVKVVECEEKHNDWKYIRLEGAGAIYLSPYARKNKEINAGNYMYFTNEKDALKYAQTKFKEAYHKLSEKAKLVGYFC